MNNTVINILRTSISHYQAGYEYFYAAVVLILSLVVYRGTKVDPHLARIPSVGGDGFFSSWRGALHSVRNANSMVFEGYQKYKDVPGVFRVPLIQRWQVLVTSKEHTEELLRVPEDVLSMVEATKDSIAADYTIGPNASRNPYHVSVLRGTLNRNLADIFPDIHDEIVHAFMDTIPVTDGWSKVPAYKTFLKIVARSANRVFVGLPKCRDPDYLKLNTQYTMDVVMAAQAINMSPRFLKSLVGKLVSRIPITLKKGVEQLGPVIYERQHMIELYGPDYPDKPNDMLSWLMDAAKDEELTIENLTMRILVTNFTALHTTSTTLVHAIYHLAARPEYLKPLRTEIETIIDEEGWTKNAVSRMRKLDSFVKESMRTPGMRSTSVIRKALKPYTFADGLHIPKGTSVGAIFAARNHDEEIYHGGAAFDGFRFSELGEDASSDVVSTNADWLIFGHGRHACPGRFFAVMEMKSILSHLILNYDIKLQNEGVRPLDESFVFFNSPNRTAEVLLRKRQVDS